MVKKVLSIVILFDFIRGKFLVVKKAFYIDTRHRIVSNLNLEHNMNQLYPKNLEQNYQILYRCKNSFKLKLKIRQF
jgi:hypothetical protein